MADELILAGDIGGTKTSLALVTTESGDRTVLAQATFVSAQYPSLSALIKEFLDHAGQQPARACFGVAGPVLAGRVKTTNLAWEIVAEELVATHGLAEVKLINDLVAIALATPLLGPEDLRTIHPGTPEAGGVTGVIAPGTGLGEAFLTWDDHGYQAMASEGGHVDFAPTSPQQDHLLAFLRQQSDHVSYEKACSGLAIPSLYAFLKAGGAIEPPWLSQLLAAASDSTPIIIDAALDDEHPCPLCQQTLELFIDILAAEAGNLALKVMATGGIYLGGGIPPRILPALESGGFSRTFTRKGRFSPLLAKIPVQVIMNPQAALLGAAALAMEKTDDK